MTEEKLSTAKVFEAGAAGVVSAAFTYLGVNALVALNNSLGLGGLVAGNIVYVLSGIALIGGVASKL